MEQIGLSCSSRRGNKFRMLVFKCLEREAPMPHYYFDLRDGEGIAVDEEGLTLRDLDAAQAEAARVLGDMARDAVRTCKDREIQRMVIEVRGDSGPVFHVRFCFEIERKN